MLTTVVDNGQDWEDFRGDDVVFALACKEVVDEKKGYKGSQQSLSGDSLP